MSSSHLASCDLSSAVPSGMLRCLFRCVFRHVAMSLPQCHEACWDVSSACHEACWYVSSACHEACWDVSSACHEACWYVYSACHKACWDVSCRALSLRGRPLMKRGTASTASVSSNQGPQQHRPQDDLQENGTTSLSDNKRQMTQRIVDIEL